MASFEERMYTAVREGDIPGAVVMASNTSGTFKYAKAFGGSDKPYDLDTPMKIMSCTKLITSLCALQCVEKELIGLDEDVSKYLPGIQQKVLLSVDDGNEPVFEDLKTPVTLRVLLTHSSGTVHAFPGSLLGKYRVRQGKIQSAESEPTVNARYSGPLAFQPGSAWEYGAGHDWTAKLVEVLTGQDLDSYIKAHVAPQLGITTMTFWPQKNGLLEKIPLTMLRKGSDHLKGLVGGKYDANAKLIEHPHNAWDNVYEKQDCFGGGGLTSSASDYFKVVHSLLANDGKILKRETVDLMMTPQLTSAAKKSLVNGFFTNAPMRLADLAPGEYDPNIGLDWGLGAMLTLENSPGWRGKGTFMWSGMTNLLWFVDRENDVCGYFGTQLLPTGDDRCKAVITMWEKEMRRFAKVVKSNQ